MTNPMDDLGAELRTRSSRQAHDAGAELYTVESKLRDEYTWKRSLAMTRAEAEALARQMRSNGAETKITPSRSYLSMQSPSWFDSAHDAATPEVGSYVKVPVATPSGVNMRRAKVTRIMSDGRVETRIAEGGYHVVSASEISQDTEIAGKDSAPAGRWGGRKSPFVGDADAGLGRGLVSLFGEQRGVTKPNSSWIDLPSSQYREVTPPPKKTQWQVVLAAPNGSESFVTYRTATKEEAEQEARSRAPNYRIKMTRKVGDEDPFGEEAKDAAPKGRWGGRAR